MEDTAAFETVDVDNSSDFQQEQEPSNNNTEDNSYVEENTNEPTNDTVNAENETIDDEGKEEHPQSKFKNFEDANNAYLELEKKYGQQSTELGELRKKAELADRLQQEQLQIVQNYGFNTVEDFRAFQQEQQYNTTLARFEADEYAKHLDRCEYPDQVKGLLMAYRDNPSEELLEAIEADFPLDVIKTVSGNMAQIRGQLQLQQEEAQRAAIYNSAKDYLDVNVNKYADEFKNQAFTDLYTEAFKALGCDLDTDKFVSLINNFKAQVINDFKVKNGIKNENINATDEISGLSNSSSETAKPQEKDILSMSEAEMLKELRKYK